MFDAKRGFLAAFAGLAALLCAAGFGAFYGSVYAPDKSHYATIAANRGQTYPSDSPRNGLENVRGIDSLTQSAIAKPKPRNTEEREQRDLAAQESMAIWTFWMVVFAGVTTIITGIGTVFIAIQVKLTRGAVVETRDATKAMIVQNLLTENGNRAWLSVEPTEIGPISYDENGNYRINFKLSLTNHGNMPALAVSCTAELQRTKSEMVDMDDFVQRSIRLKSGMVKAVAPKQTISDGLENYLLDCEGLEENGRWPSGASAQLLIGATYIYPGGDEICYTVLSVFPCINLKKHDRPIKIFPQAVVMQTLMS